MSNRIEETIKDVCISDLLESEDRDYTMKQLKEIVSDELINRIVSSVWNAQEEHLRNAVTEWENKDGNFTN